MDTPKGDILSQRSTFSAASDLFDSISPLVNVMKYIRKRQGLEYNVDASLNDSTYMKPSTDADKIAKQKLGFVRD